MALIPEGAALEVSPSVSWPTIRLRNTWLLPGIPEVFRMKLPVALAGVVGGPAYVSHSVYLMMDEGELKPLLDAAVRRFSDVSIGSYPSWKQPAYRTMVTFDGRDAQRVRASRDAFVASLPRDEPQRVE
jgi:molybdopterin-biosynthesis enzyme MoeA-like protein